MTYRSNKQRKAMFANMNNSSYQNNIQKKKLKKREKLYKKYPINKDLDNINTQINRLVASNKADKESVAKVLNKADREVKGKPYAYEFGKETDRIRKNWNIPKDYGRANEPVYLADVPDRS